MSRWLQSVNNLLENLDGQAENVAETVAAEVGNTSSGGLGRRLLDSGRQAVADRWQGEEEEVYEDEDPDFTDDEEEADLIDEDVEAAADIQSQEEDLDMNETYEEDLGGIQSQSQGALGVSVRRRPSCEDATVSDISFSEFSEDEEHHRNSHNRQALPEAEDIDTTASKPTNTANTVDSALKTPSRRGSNVGSATSIPTDPNSLNAAGAIPKHSQASMSTSTQHRQSPKSHSNSRIGSITPLSSPKVDASPIPPRRSLDVQNMPIAGANLLEEGRTEDRNTAATTASTVSGSKSNSKAVPPKPPARQASHTNASPPPAPISNAGVSTSSSTINSQLRVTPAQPPLGKTVSNVTPKIANSNQTKASSKGTSNPTTSKEYLKLKEKFQALQTKHSQMSNEFKTSQTQVHSLQTQVQALTTKLDTAQTEISAQSDELRRAGERMEAERLRSHDEREDLLDEQEEELEQLKETQKKEMDGLRNQYESQIADLTRQLEDEETRRRQEGGDYTQELQDAIGRERDALKRLNGEVAEKNKLQTTLTSMESQQASLQSKLDHALQAVKTASDREREAQDKLDASISLHARQMGQRQTREAELEKTIFDLGTALTLAKQKVGATAPSSSTVQNGIDASSSYKDRYHAAEEELETLKVQYGMETQRREALQEELNEIANERTTEIANARARQQLTDRKVADLEATVARLQSSLQSHKSARSAPLTADTTGPTSTGLNDELKTAKQEIKGLSSQLLRQQGIAENSKSEILALKGRLQAAVSRAEQAERALHTAQMSTPRLYGNGGGNGAGIRRRVKGANTSRNRTRTIRSALQMSPGRAHHPAMEQVAQTLDALDAWMVDTGSFLKHEPLARLGFLLYLMLLHLWCFVLVVFHTTEQPHGDFGSMDNNPRHWRAAVNAIQQQQQQQTSP